MLKRASIAWHVIKNLSGVSYSMTVITNPLMRTTTWTMIKMTTLPPKTIYLTSMTMFPKTSLHEWMIGTIHMKIHKKTLLIALQTNMNPYKKTSNTNKVVTRNLQMMSRVTTMGMMTMIKMDMPKIQECMKKTQNYTSGQGNDRSGRTTTKRWQTNKIGHVTGARRYIPNWTRTKWKRNAKKMDTIDDKKEL